MAKQTKKSKQAMELLYKEYSRRKYNKLRSQYPKKSEAEIIQKIIKQWQGLDNSKKQQLEKQYNLSGGFHSKSDSQSKKESSSSKRKIRSGGGPAKQETSRSKSKGISKSNKSKSIKIIHEHASDKGSQAQHQVKSQPQQSQSQRSVLVGKGKTKKIKKGSGPNADYLQFFKYYYQRLNKEHPKWTSAQISTIIKLLWKRRQIQSKKQKSKKPGKLRSTKQKITSGRMTFKRVKISQGIDKSQINARWRQLPRQSKLFWEKEGGARRTIRKGPQESRRIRGLLKKGAEPRQYLTSQSTGFGFLKQRMN